MAIYIVSYICLTRGILNTKKTQVNEMIHALTFYRK